MSDLSVAARPVGEFTSMPFPAGRHVDANGIRTRVFEAGEGPTLVLIHGGGAGADSYGNWRTVLPRLVDGHRVVAVDMLGFGETDKPDVEYSQQARIAHMTSVVEIVGGGRPVHMIGNSMGGATALGVAVERPDLVASLVLMGSAGLNGEIHADLLPILNYDFTRDGMIRLIRALTNREFVIDDGLVDYRVAKSQDGSTRRAYAATMGWIKQNGGLYYADDYIRRVGVPTLVVNGKDDKVVPVSCAYRFLELIDNSWGYVIPHCGHWAMIERPDDFAEAVLRFVARHGDNVG